MRREMKQRFQAKSVLSLTVLFCLAYTVSYITRINYGAVISAMELSTGESKDILSLALTGSFITYGTGQILSGILGDRFSPKRLIAFGFLITTVMNFSIALFQNPVVMIIIWCINGFAQALMWPPMVRLLIAKVNDEEYKKIAPKISWGSSFGTIAVYLFAPLFLLFFDYRSVFVFGGIIGALMLIVWLIFAPDIQTAPPLSSGGQTEKESVSPSLLTTEKKSSVSLFFSSMMILAMLGIAFQGMLRDGVTTWMPSYISETYQISNIISILSGVILPVFSILCIQLSTALYRRVIKNPIMLAGVFFLFGAVSSFALFLLNGKNAVLSILFSALLTGCMHGTNLMLTGMLPPFFKSHGKVSTVSGVLNACTYIGSALSTYGIALLSTHIGWRWTVLIWVGIAVCGAVVCILSARAFSRRFFKAKDPSIL